MPSHNQQGRNNKVPGGYFRLHRYVMRCEAWKALTPEARCLYLVFMDRYRDHGQGKTNNGRIPLSLREAIAETGLTDWKTRKAFRDLISKGFLRVTRDSAFNMKYHLAREYALTEFAIGEQIPTKEFMSWPEKQNTVLVANTNGGGGQHRDPNSGAHNVRNNPPTVVTANTVNHTHGGGGQHTYNHHREGAEPCSSEIVQKGGASWQL